MSCRKDGGKNFMRAHLQALKNRNCSYEDSYLHSDALPVLRRRNFVYGDEDMHERIHVLLGWR